MVQAKKDVCDSITSIYRTKCLSCMFKDRCDLKGLAFDISKQNLTDDILKTVLTKFKSNSCFYTCMYPECAVNIILNWYNNPERKKDV